MCVCYLTYSRPQGLRVGDERRVAGGCRKEASVCVCYLTYSRPQGVRVGDVRRLRCACVCAILHIRDPRGCGWVT